MVEIHKTKRTLKIASAILSLASEQKWTDAEFESAIKLISMMQVDMDKEATK